MHMDTFLNDQILKIIFGFILALFILFYKVLYTDQTEISTKCSSEDCVRCSCKLKTKQIARVNLQLFIEKNNKYNLDRIKNAINKDNSINIFRKFKYLFVTPELIKQNPNILYIKELSSIPIWSTDKFKYVEHILTSSFNEILEEFKIIFQTIDLPDTRWKRNTVESGHWYLYYLYNQGSYNQGNNCPITLSIIKKLNKYLCKSLFFNVIFSVLEENSIVAPHYGPSNARIRCHLGLSIPNNECTINCGYMCERLIAGKCLFFDDSFYHGSKYLNSRKKNYIDAKNDSNLQNDLINQNEGINSSQTAVNDNYKISMRSTLNLKTYKKHINKDKIIGLKSSRCVLIIDLWHPDLTQIERNAIAYCYPSI